MVNPFRFSRAHPVTHLQQYLGAGLRVKYTLYVIGLLVMTFFPAFAGSLGGIFPQGPIAMLSLMSIAWIPLLFRRSPHLWLAIYLTSLGDVAVLVFLAQHSGGIHSPVTITFPVLSLAFGLCFYGSLAYLPAILTPILVSFVFLIREASLDVGAFLTTVWILALDALCVYAVTLYRRAEGLEKDHYQKLALVDDLTGLQNHRAFWSEVTKAFARSRRDLKPLSLLLFDLDGFKQVNDTCGHIFGDTTLAMVGNALQQHIRKADRLFRYGGDEFAVLLPEEEQEAAEFVARKLREVVAGVELYAEGKRVRISISFGLKTYDPVREILFSVEQLVDAADKALLLKKTPLCKNDNTREEPASGG